MIHNIELSNFIACVITGCLLQENWLNLSFIFADFYQGVSLLQAVNKSADFLSRYCNHLVPWSDSIWSDIRAAVHYHNRPNVRYPSLLNSSVLDPSFGRWGRIRSYHSIRDIVRYPPPRPRTYYELVVLIRLCNSLTFCSVVRIQKTFKVMSSGGTYIINYLF